jgi:hypothetical protein
MGGKLKGGNCDTERFRKGNEGVSSVLFRRVPIESLFLRMHALLTVGISGGINPCNDRFFFGWRESAKD